MERGVNVAKKDPLPYDEVPFFGAHDAPPPINLLRKNGVWPIDGPKKHRQILR